MILSVENGRFGYIKDVPVIKDISFSAKAGEILAILGPNGAGKTTLLRCTMGFLSWTGGKSTLDGQDIRTIPKRTLWQKIAYVPQAKSAAVALSAEEMILLGRSSHLGLFEEPKKGDREKVREIMSRLGIEKLSGKLCNQISGGELQMVLIARALAAEPEILILDEPESNLDFKNQLLVLDTISGLAASGKTCIFNTHYPAHALQRAGKSLILDKNGNALFGDTASVVTEANIERAFGVKAVIGEVETDKKTMKDIIPLSLATGAGQMERNAGGEQLAVISIAAKREAAERINALLHEYSALVVGRMGMPYKKYDVNIINLTLDGPKEELTMLTARLGAIDGVSVKTVYVEKD